MNSPLVSIGIPVYNVEPYIEKCLLSVLNQTYQNLEILIVDDLGTDKSMDVVAGLQQSHPFGNCIKIIRHPENRGLGEARNTVIENAEGKYLYFVDSDDYIEPEAIEALLREAEEYDTDAVLASSRKIVYGTNEEMPTFTYKSREIIIGKDAFANYLCQDLRWHIGINAWNILFKLDFLKKNNLRFAARKDEDALFLSDFYSEVERAVLLPDVTYNYVLRPGSIMGNQVRDRIPVAEIRERFKTDAKMTERCARLKGRSFYDVHCARVVKHKFRAACVAIRHRQRFTEPLPDAEIRLELKHPASLSDIISFNRYRLFNLFFYLISIMPPYLSVKVTHLVGKIIGWI
jgi:glycosyltransferase involved in cell wall biosynthesis